MDFDINDWLEDNQRFLILADNLEKSIHLLKQSNCLEKVLYYWVRHEVINSYRSDHPKCINTSDQSIILDWSMEQNQHRLNEIFLEKKDLLDIVSFNMIKVENHAVAFELYHRLVATESTFGQISSTYSVSSDKDKDTLRKNLRIGSLPKPLQDLLRTMNEGEVSKPLEFNQAFVIIRLEQYQRAEFTDSIKNKLLLDQFSAWATSVAQVCHDRLS